MGSATDILVLPFFGQGHLNPCSELCQRLSSHNRKSIIIIPSHLSSSIPSDLHRHPSVEVAEIDTASFPPPDDSTGEFSGPKMRPGNHQLGLGIEAYLSERYGNTRPAFVVIDVLMSWSKEIFKKKNIPFVSFFTTGACATAMEYVAVKARDENVSPEEARIVPGLPEGLALSDADSKRQNRKRRGDGAGRGSGSGRGPGGPNSGPPRPPLPRMMEEAEGSAALLLNTCDDLEAPFLEYLSGQVEKPVFGVGPLLPDSFWESIGSAVHDSDSRPSRDSNYTEDEVIQWLDSKPAHSVIYISFGSEVGPSIEEYDNLAEALAESEKSFIWVIQPSAGKTTPLANLFGVKPSTSSEEDEEEGYEPHGLEEKVGNRGLIIKGWAPQLAILSHPSTGGFLSHCGWNSTVEAICCGVPILAWPIGRDQFYDANLLAKYLNVAHKVLSSDDQSGTVKKADITRGIEELMGDTGVRDRAMALRGVFKAGYPSSSAASLMLKMLLATAPLNHRH